MRLPMYSHSLPSYELLGGHPPKRRWREYIFSPYRRTAILLIVVLSLTCIGFLEFQEREWPWMGTSTSIAPNAFLPSITAELEEPTPVLLPPSPETPSVSAEATQPTLSLASPPKAALIGATKYHPFSAPTAKQALADPKVQPVRAQAVLSDACLDRWVSTGQWTDPCQRRMVDESKIDLVYIWTNGSDALHQEARKALLKQTKYRTKEARFREHDELRYSLRAARTATRTWPNSTWHIITADVRDPEAFRETRSELAIDSEISVAEPETENNTDEGQRRLGLVPQWLDFECSFYGEDGFGGQPPIRLQHDTQIFRLTSNAKERPEPKDAEAWLKRILPSFNSHAVESQLPQLDPAQVSDNIVALNDDQFMMLPSSPSAFHTTLYGPVFRMDPSLLVTGDPYGKADGGGEWRGLGWSAHILNQRFGTRKRPYMQHNARSLSLPLMHEATLVFGDYFAKTPLSQFRGSHKASGELEVNTIFLTTYFIVERHREALLYSWVVLKWGGETGVLDIDGMWADLGGAADRDVLVLDFPADRTTSNDVELNLLMAGVVPPKPVDDNVEMDTAYTWTSMDGFSREHNQLLTRTTIKRDFCFKGSSESPWDLFRRLLKVDTDCGDSIISALIHKQKSGLGAFLPAASRTDGPASANPPTLPLSLPISAPSLPPNPRAFAVRLFQRYAYVYGDSPTLFVSLTDAKSTTRWLTQADKLPATSMICLNDDLGNSRMSIKKTEAVLDNWFEEKWPEKLLCEV